MWSLGRRLWRDVLSGYGWGFFAVSVVDVVIGLGSKCLYPPSYLAGPLPPFLMIKRGECGGWSRCCLLLVPEEHFMLEDLTAAHRCLRWSRRAAWSTPAWPLTVCCLQEGHPDPTAVHKAVSSSVCVPLPGEWSLKTLMSVPEISCQWGEAVTETRFWFWWTPLSILERYSLLFGWLSFLTWCCFCLGFFPVTGDFSLQWRWNTSTCFLGLGGWWQGSGGSSQHDNETLATVRQRQQVQNKEPNQEAGIAVLDSWLALLRTKCGDISWISSKHKALSEMLMWCTWGRGMNIQSSELIPMNSLNGHLVLL